MASPDESAQRPDIATAPFVIGRRDVALVTVASGLGYAFDAYAVNLFGMLGPAIMADLHITVRAFGLIGSVFLVG